MGAPYIYEISRLRVKFYIMKDQEFSDFHSDYYLLNKENSTS